MMRGAVLRLLIGWLLAASIVAGEALAQQTDLAPSPETMCLTNVNGIDRPVYPPEALRAKEGGVIDVTLTFANSQTPPGVTFREAPGVGTFGGLRSAIEDYARGLRVPCMSADASPSVLRQRYVFVPNDGRKVVRSRPLDAADEQRRQQSQCIRHVDGDVLPECPEEARRDEAQGNVLVKLVFTAANEPPTSEVLASVNSRALRRSITTHAAGLRMPCFLGTPVQVQQLYTFKLDAGRRLLVKDMPLRQFLAAVKDRPPNVYFDLTQMGCPFDVRITYARPYRTNTVLELEASNPARAAFLDWLAVMTFDVPERQNTAFLGQEFVVQVPCGIVDL